MSSSVKAKLAGAGRNCPWARMHSANHADPALETDTTVLTSHAQGVRVTGLLLPTSNNMAHVGRRVGPPTLIPTAMSQSKTHHQPAAPCEKILPKLKWGLVDHGPCEGTCTLPANGIPKNSQAWFGPRFLQSCFSVKMWEQSRTCAFQSCQDNK